MKKLICIFSILSVLTFTFSCSKSEDSNPTSDTPGPKFLATKSVVSSSCASSGCHASPSNAGGINFESNSSIVSNASKIKTQAVDMGTMPPGSPLSATDKTKITDWINAGGRVTD